MAGAVGEPDACERGAADLLRLRAAMTRDLPQRKRHVRERGHVRVEVEGLEHHADAPARAVDVGAPVEHVDAIDHDRARGGLLQSVEAAQERRLARPGRADHEDELALGHDEVDATQHVQGAEMLVDPARLDDRARGSAGGWRGCQHLGSFGVGS